MNRGGVTSVLCHGAHDAFSDVESVEAYEMSQSDRAAGRAQLDDLIYIALCTGSIPFSMSTPT